MNDTEHIAEIEIDALVEQFYAKVRRDPDIGPLFNENVHNWDAHIALLKDFWSTVLLRTGRYKGNPLVVHFDLQIDPIHFTRWLALFSETATDLMPGSKAQIVIQKAELIALNLKRVRSASTQVE